MKAISNVSFCSNIRTNTTKKTNQTNPQYKPQHENYISKELMALAMIGAATLQSCVKTELDYIPEKEEIFVDDDFQIEHKSTIKKFDTMLKDIGLLKDGLPSIKYANTISFNDPNDNTHFLELTNINNDTLKLQHLKLKPDYTGFPSTITIKSAGDSIFVTDKTDEKETRMLYKKDKNDNSYTEYKYINGIYFQTAKITKNDGNMVKIYPDNTIEVYDNISNEEEMPEAISLNPNCGDWNNHNDSIDY